MAVTLTLSELMRTLESAGYDLTDARGLPIGPQLEQALEDDNLHDAPAHITFRDRPTDGGRGVIADVTAGEESFLIEGNPRRLEELKNLLRSVPATPDEGQL